MFSSANQRRKIFISADTAGLQLVQLSARTQNDGLRMLAQKLPEQDNQPTIIDGPEKSGISVTSVVALSLCPTAVTIPPSRPTFVDLHVSQFGWSAVSPSRPAISQSVGRSGGQGKRAAARSHAQPPLCGEHGEHGEHWTLMAAATGATPDQAGCVRTSASASHNPHSASGSGSGKPIKKRDRNSINCRDPAHLLFQLLDLMDIQSATQDRSLLDALAVVSKHRHARRHELSEVVDLGFASQRWQSYVGKRRSGSGVVDRRTLEVCVFVHLADALQTGDLYVVGAEDLPTTVLNSPLVGVREAAASLLRRPRHLLTRRGLRRCAEGRIDEGSGRGRCRILRQQ